MFSVKPNDGTDANLEARLGTASLHENPKEKSGPVKENSFQRFIKYAIFDADRFETLKKTSIGRKFGAIKWISMLMVFLPDGDKIDLGRNYKNKHTSNEGIKVNAFNKLSIALLFFGMAKHVPYLQYRPEANADPKAKNPHAASNSEIRWAVAKNFIGGWHEADAFILHKIANWVMLKPLLFITLNTLGIVTSTVTNTLRLVTEVLPMVIEKYLLFAAAAVERAIEPERGAPESTAQFVLSRAASSPLLALSLVFKALGLAGRALTSPVSSMVAGWKAGRVIDGPVGVVIGTALAAVSCLISAKSFTYLLPLLATTIVAHAPTALAWMSSFNTPPAIPGVSTLFAKIGGFIGQNLQSMFLPVVGNGIGFGVHQAKESGIGATLRGWGHHIKQAFSSNNKAPVEAEEAQRLVDDAAPQPQPVVASQVDPALREQSAAAAKVDDEFESARRRIIAGHVGAKSALRTVENSKDLNMSADVAVAVQVDRSVVPNTKSPILLEA